MVEARTSQAGETLAQLTDGPRMICGKGPSTTCNWTLFLNCDRAKRVLSFRFYAGS
jgi:hypothetical protein